MYIYMCWFFNQHMSVFTLDTLSLCCRDASQNNSILSHTQFISLYVASNVENGETQCLELIVLVNRCKIYVLLIVKQ